MNLRYIIILITCAAIALIVYFVFFSSQYTRVDLPTTEPKVTSTVPASPSPIEARKNVVSRKGPDTDDDGFVRAKTPIIEKKPTATLAPPTSP